MNRGAFTLFCFALVLSLTARAQQISLPFSASARSVSGQFVVIGGKQVSSLAVSRAVTTNADYVRLEPALLAITAERIKDAVWQQLGVDNPEQWRGQIFLSLHPARSLDENVRIVSTRFVNHWDCRVELPDVLSRARLVRAITAAVMLEYADRAADKRSAELPSWLVEGMSEQVTATGLAGFILTSPSKTVNGLLESRIVTGHSGLNALGGVHRALKDRSALTFSQLSWPTDEQLAGDDGGVYRASAQLFVNDLLHLNNGPREMRAMIQLLPRYYNWQFAFRDAFRRDFPMPIDVEKWWALQVVNFASEEVGPMWTPAASLEKLNETLSVAVEFRPASNNLPSHAEISLQDAIRNFDSGRKAVILQAKLRDLGIAELRMSPHVAALCAEYRQALADYAGQKIPVPRTIYGKHRPAAPSKTDLRKTLETLDALDAQRRTMEAKIDTVTVAQ